MKKLGFGLIGLVLIAAVYYFTNGSAQVIRQAKQQLNNELSTLQQSGFSVKERKSEKKKDHFIISFDNPEKIVQYLNTQGAEMALEDAKALKGLQVGVDAKYLPDSYSAVSLDLYPVALPNDMMKELEEEDKKLVNHLRDMLAQKALLLHVDFNKMLSGFKGYIKDINETIEEDGEKATIAAKGMTFEGETKEEKISQFSQKIALLSLDAGKALQVKVSDIDGGYIRTGTTPYDITSRYRTGSIAVHMEPQLSLQIKNIENETKNSVNQGLLKSIVTTKAETVEINQAQKKYTIEKSLFDFTAENLDVAALEALQKTDPGDEARINQLTQQLLSKGIVLTLNKFSAKKITENGKNLNGFDMNGTVSIAKSFDMNAVSQNPLLALDAIDIRTHISVSDELYAHIFQDPRAMIMMMMVPPATKEGKKIYDIVFVKGKITVNGISF
ncbi:hypothetical protein [Sulfurovum sp. NBC37-1]|uniref:hypothetical protein n=1 Tax=Sulfurovum sp. (strain NBC37-1) TaxID=387093 RepID=UPI0001587D8B|nr:hypothetical protein [Sulfurovum sp. NBC37-1]BAF73201.1 hypothetical protein SUN_2261 [Sulfurovum sp. NBC37-1]